VALVDDDAVVLVDRRPRRVVVGSEHALDHGLDGGDVQAGVGSDLEVGHLLDAEDVGEGLELLEAQLLEGVGGLAREGVAVDEEEHATEAASLEQAVAEADAGAGLAGARRHGEEHLSLAVLERGLDREDGAALVVAVDVRHRLDLEGRVGAVEVLLEQIDAALRGCTSPRAGRGWFWAPAGVEEPDAALVDELTEEGAAVGGEDEGDPIGPPGAALGE
jgi:hypothetical protein